MNNKIFLLKSFKSWLQCTGCPIPSKRPKQGLTLQCSGEDIQQMLVSICHISWSIILGVTDLLAVNDGR